MRLFRAILLRLGYGALSLLFISFVTFVASNAAPGDPARLLAGEKADEATVARVRSNLGLDRPWTVRYVEYVTHAAKGDLGTSYYGTREPVADTIKAVLPTTVKVAVWSILVASLFGVTLGTLASVWEGRFADKLVLGLSTFGVTLPNFVLAPMLVLYFVVGRDLLPLTWEEPMRAPEIYYLILPVTILALRPMALIARLTRASMIETFRQEFIRMAIAKGVPFWRMVVRHALRNAILPVLTAIGTSFGVLLTGSFVVETFFLIPGIGQRTIQAITQNDVMLIQGCVLVTGALFILINLLVDLALPFFDPRIRESQV
ncbi:ABC transporter permease [bacterium]|nr:MAG: ABC transporter permease [bacterium]